MVDADVKLARHAVMAIDSEGLGTSCVGLHLAGLQYVNSVYYKGDIDLRAGINCTRRMSFMRSAAICGQHLH